MLLSGRKLTAQEACGKGLVSQVFWPGTFTQEVMVRIKELASCNPVVRQIHSVTCVTFFFFSHDLYLQRVHTFPSVFLNTERLLPAQPASWEILMGM